MKSLVLNETPIRTCNNYLINNIELKKVSIPKIKKNFGNMIFQDLDENIEVSMDVSQDKLKYGNGEELESQFENANVKLKLVIKKNSKKANIINFIFDKENSALVDNIEIIAENNVKADIVIRYAINSLSSFANADLRYLSNSTCQIEKCQNDMCLIKAYGKEEVQEAFYHNGLIRTEVKEGAKLNITVENLMSKNDINFISFDNKIADLARLDYNYIDFGADKRVINYYSNVAGKKAINRFNSLYLGDGEQVLDYNYIAEIYGKEADVNIEVQGAIRDNVRKNFKGTIDFKSGCTKAKGAENEFCTLLSDTAKALSLPMLLCTEEDVEGAHSTAAGKVDQDELFYIKTRGFTDKEAEKLIVRANFNAVIEGIPNADIKQEVISQMEFRL